MRNILQSKIKIFILFLALIFVNSCNSSGGSSSPSKGVIKGTISKVLNAILPTAYADDAPAVELCTSTCAEGEKCADLSVLNEDTKVFDYVCSTPVDTSSDPATYEFKVNDEELDGRAVKITFTKDDGSVREIVLYHDASSDEDVDLDAESTLDSGNIEDICKDSDKSDDEKKASIEHLHNGSNLDFIRGVLVSLGFDLPDPLTEEEFANLKDELNALLKGSIADIKRVSHHRKEIEDCVSEKESSTLGTTESGAFENECKAEHPEDADDLQAHDDLLANKDEDGDGVMASSDCDDQDENNTDSCVDD